MSRDRTVREDMDEAAQSAKNTVRNWRDEASEKVDELKTKAKSEYSRLRRTSTPDAVRGYFGHVMANGQNWRVDNPNQDSFTAKPPPKLYMFATCGKCKADADECRCHRGMHMLGQDDFTNMNCSKVIYDIHFIATVVVIGCTVWKIFLR